jgi:MFS family permease
MVDSALQVVASFNAGRAYGAAMGLVRGCGAVARIVGPLLAGVLFDVDFGSFIDRHRLLPFWVGALGSCAAALVCSRLVNTDPPSFSSKASP